MKYCLSSRNQRDYLSKADEIKVEYRDRKDIQKQQLFYSASFMKKI